MITYIKVNHTPTQRTYKPKKTEYIHYGLLKVLEVWENLSEVAKVRLLGLGLLIIGIFGCVAFPEDAGGGLFACGIGLLFALFYNGIETEWMI